MDFPGDSTWCFFVPNHYKQLVSDFFWRNGVHFHFPMFLPAGVQAVGFSNLNVPILNVHIPQIRQSGRLTPFDEIPLKQATVKSTISTVTSQIAVLVS